MDLPEPRRFAIVYGINTYPPIVNSLTYPVADATSVRDMLASHGYIVQLRTESSATKAQLILDIASAAALVGPDDLLLFYYSGHGTQSTSQGVTREWILPYGSVDAATGSIIEGNAIYDAELGAMLGSLRTQRRVIIIDACNSGGFVGNTLEVDRTPPAFLRTTEGLTWSVIGKAVQYYMDYTRSPSTGISPYDSLVISAAGANEFSIETDGYRHGVFTYYLLQAPSSADLNGDGAVTAVETYAFVKAQLDRYWNPTAPISFWLDPSNPDPTLHDTFSPHVSGGAVDYVLF
jgi:uncharacterized caspase-like protein